MIQKQEVQLFEQTTKAENGLIWITPLCEFFNLHVQNQYTKIKNDPILGNLYGKNSTDSKKNKNLVVKNHTDLGQIDSNGRILLSKKGFLRWIQIINVSTIDENLREQFISYQSNIIDYLFGIIEEKQNTSMQYARLQKLKRLSNHINKEIKVCEKEVKEYVEAHLGIQQKLALKESK